MNSLVCKTVTIVLGLVLPISDLFSQNIVSERSTIRVNSVVAKKELSPDIQILEPKTLKMGETFLASRQSVTLAMKLINPEEGMKVLVNNVEIPSTPNGDVFLHTFDLYSGSNMINISLLNNNKTIKEYVYNMVYVPKVENISPYAMNLGKFYALIIANETYISPEIPSLKRPIADAKALKEILATKYTFERENIYTLYNMRRDNLIMTLDDIQKKLTPEDNLLIYYAGHGKMDIESGIGYWLLSDAALSSRVNWFSNSALTDYIKAIKAKHIFLIADACYAGSVFYSRGVFEDAPPSIADIYKNRSRTAMTSGGTTEVNDESKFSEILLKQLIDNTEQYLTSGQLFRAIEKPVMNNSSTAPRFGIIQGVNDMQGDFVFIIR